MNRYFLSPALLFLTLSCTSHPEPVAPPRPLALLVDSHKIPCEFLWEQEVSATYGPVTRSFPAVVQCSEGHLTLLGLTPFSTRAFLVEQEGVKLEFTSFVTEPLPFSGEDILTDLHLVFFVGTGEPAQSEGVRVSRATSGPRHDVFHGGKLVERRYLSERGEVEARIVYEGGFDGHTPPPALSLENLRIGYSLHVVTNKVTVLAPASPSAPHPSATTETVPNEPAPIPTSEPAKN